MKLTIISDSFLPGSAQANFRQKAQVFAGNLMVFQYLDQHLRGVRKR
ncbi:MAG: hypothetical protein HC880_04305 [Bacteroidia bacterium]|nr:hypothetical protein [Bacteroidia bacterium]